jgi:diguanylate cyclase (GGDEF)-like protein
VAGTVDWHGPGSGPWGPPAGLASSSAGSPVAAKNGSEPVGQEKPAVARRRDLQKKGSHVKVYSLMALAVAVMLGVPALVLHAQQNSQRSQLENTFRNRAPVTSAFVTAYVTELANHQRAEAATYLSADYPADAVLPYLSLPGGSSFVQSIITQQNPTCPTNPQGPPVSAPLWPSPSQQLEFQEFVDSFGFQSAILLAAPSDTVLAISAPSSAALMSQPGTGASGALGSQCDANHSIGLQAVGVPNLLPGQVQISNLTSPAGFPNDNTPVFEVETGFHTPYGNRILIGSYQTGPGSTSPINDFLPNAVPNVGTHPMSHEVFLVDSLGYVLACSDTEVSLLDLAPVCQPSRNFVMTKLSGASNALSSQDANLADAIKHSDRGFYTASDGQPSYFVVQAISHTPWRLVMAVPTSQLFATISGHTFLFQWAMFGIYALLVIFAAELFYRFIQSRNQLQALTQELDLVSRLDPLTGIYNRRHLDDTIGNTVSTVKRHNQSLALVIADVDHFKRVNDTYGHDAGDTVLVEVTSRMMKTLRSGDLLGRWGGEEFLIVLPMTTVEGARLAAERMREIVAATPITLEDGQQLNITASFGCAAMRGEDADPDALIRRADAALYEAKEGGRNRVVVDPASLAGEAQAPAQPAPSQPAPSQPAPTSQTASQEPEPPSAPAQPAPSQPAPSQPAQAQAAPAPQPPHPGPPPPQVALRRPAPPGLVAPPWSADDTPPLAPSVAPPPAPAEVPATTPEPKPEAPVAWAPPPAPAEVPATTPEPKPEAPVAWAPPPAPPVAPPSTFVGSRPSAPPGWAPPDPASAKPLPPVASAMAPFEPSPISSPQPGGEAPTPDASQMPRLRDKSLRLPPPPPGLDPPYPDWWLASDGNWYPPELHPATRAR